VGTLTDATELRCVILYAWEEEGEGGRGIVGGISCDGSYSHVCWREVENKRERESKREE